MVAHSCVFNFYFYAYALLQYHGKLRQCVLHQAYRDFSLRLLDMPIDRHQSFETQITGTCKL